MPATIRGSYLGIAGAIVLYVMWRGRGDDAAIFAIMFVIAGGLSVGMVGFLARDTWNNISDS